MLPSAMMVDERKEHNRFWISIGWKNTTAPDPKALIERCFWSDGFNADLSRSQIAVQAPVLDQWKIITDWQYSADFLLSKTTSPQKRLTDFVRYRTSWRLRAATVEELKARQTVEKAALEEVAERKRTARSKRQQRAESEAQNRETALQKVNSILRSSTPESTSRRLPQQDTDAATTTTTDISSAEHVHDAAAEEKQKSPEETQKLKLQAMPRREIRLDFVLMCVVVGVGLLQFCWLPSILELLLFSPLAIALLSYVLYVHRSGRVINTDRFLSDESTLLLRGRYKAAAQVPAPLTHCFMYFDATSVPQIEAVRANVQHSILANRALTRLKCKPIRRNDGRYSWHELGEEDIDFLYHVTTREVQTDVELQQCLEDQVSAPLPQDRPLWDVLLIRTFASDGKSCIVFRVHNAVGDADSLLEALLSLCTDELSQTLSRPAPSPRKLQAFVQASLLTRVMAGAKHALKLLPLVLKMDTESTLGSPCESPEHYQYSGTRKVFLGTAFDLETLNNMVAAVNGKPRGERDLQASTHEEDRLDPPPESKNKKEEQQPVVVAIDELEVSVNSVLTYLWGKAVVQYLEAKHLSTTTTIDADSLIRFLIPCTIPLPVSGNSMHTKSGNISFQVPLTAATASSSDTAAEVRSVHVALQQALTGQEPVLRRAANSIAQLVDLQYAQQLNSRTYLSHSLVLQCAPAGPTQPILFSDMPVTACYFASLSAIPSVSMLSYNQELRMTLVYDDKVLTDPEYLFELFGEIWDATNAVLTEEDTMSELSSSFAHSVSSNKGHRLSMASRTVPLPPPAEDEFDELYDPAYLKRRGQSDEHKVELD